MKDMAMESLWEKLRRFRVLGASLAGAAVIFISGIVFWGGFNTVMEATNTMEFCITCHEMRDNVYVEYKKTIHYENRTGVRATCPDCHVPRPWIHKMIRKVQASNEVFHWLLGSVNTPEKFDAKRLELAKHVWVAMRENDSRECRNCHSFEGMGADKQKQRARKQHENAQADGNTCIDCHKGIAHKPVHQLLSESEAEALSKPEPSRAALRSVALVNARDDAAKKAEAAKAAPAPAAPAGAAPSAPAPVAVAVASAPAASGAGSAIDWSKVPVKEVKLLYPGQTSYEWIQTGTDHGGARAYKKGEACAGCHEGEQPDMGKKMVSGEKAETTPIPGKPASIPLSVQAAHDGTNLTMRFQWPGNPHAPAPFADGGKMDPENQVKLALMIDAGKVTDADRSGCWSTCHHDSKSMPDAPAGGGVTKYLPQTRTEISLKDSPRGGADKLKPADQLAALMTDGVFLDLIRWKSNGDVFENGYVSAERVMTGGVAVTGGGKLENGVWTLVLSRPLVSTAPGDVSLEPGKVYTVGFAVHDDYAAARFHHVSVNYVLGLDNAGAGVNIVKQ
jgi:nitrate/TMAO reductase-like tetraheme cytochrome c subunit